MQRLANKILDVCRNILSNIVRYTLGLLGKLVQRDIVILPKANATAKVNTDPTPTILLSQQLTPEQITPELIVQLQQHIYKLELRLDYLNYITGTDSDQHAEKLKRQHGTYNRNEIARVAQWIGRR